MKKLIQLEEVALFALPTLIFFHFYEGAYVFYLAAFFVPDTSFLAYLLNPKIGAISYNLLHHRGFLFLCFLAGYFAHIDYLSMCGLVFLAHSSFDRVFGYGLKHFDSFNNTHLGWVGKKKGTTD